MALPLLGLGMLAGRLGLTFGMRRAAVVGAEAVASRAAVPAAELAAAAAARGTSVASMAGPAARVATNGAEAVAGAAAAGAEVAAAAAPSLLARTASTVATTGTAAVGVGHVANQAVRAPFEGITQVIGKAGEVIGQYAPQIALVTGAVLAGVAMKNWLSAPATEKLAAQEARPMISNALYEGRVMLPALAKAVH